MDKSVVDRETIERLSVIRKYRRLSQAQVAEWLGISQAAYSKRESKGKNGEGNDGFSAGDFTVILEKTQVDARWLFGQIRGPIERADLKIVQTDGAASDVKELIESYREMKERYGKVDSITEQLNGDWQLREAVKLLIQNKGRIQRVIGYLDRLSEEEKGEEDVEKRA